MYGLLAVFVAGVLAWAIAFKLVAVRYLSEPLRDQPDLPDLNDKKVVSKYGSTSW